MVRTACLGQRKCKRICALERGAAVDRDCWRSVQNVPLDNSRYNEYYDPST